MMALIEEAHKAARLLLDHAYVRIVARAEPDAVCAVALLGHALRRENVDFHATWVPRLDEARAAAVGDESPDATLLVGLGGDAAGDHAIGGRRVALDRAASTLEGEAVLDATRRADAQDDLSLSGLAQLVAVAMSRRNADLAPLALAGATSAHGHGGRLRGLDAEILSEAIENEVLLREPALALHGATLVQALAQMDAPFVSGITGRATQAKRLVASLKLDPDAPPAHLKGADAERLGSYLAARLLEQDAPDAALDALFRPAARALKGPHTGMESVDLARRVEAACAVGRPGLGLAAAWPDPASVTEAVDAMERFRTDIVAALARAERERRVEGKLMLADAHAAPACAPLADRMAAALAPAGGLAVARHADDADHVTLALRAHHAPFSVAGALRHAVAAVGGRAVGTREQGRAHLDAADEQRFLKALAEALQ